MVVAWNHCIWQYGEHWKRFVVLTGTTNPSELLNGQDCSYCVSFIDKPVTKLLPNSIAYTGPVSQRRPNAMTSSSLSLRPNLCKTGRRHCQHFSMSQNRQYKLNYVLRITCFEIFNIGAVVVVRTGRKTFFCGLVYVTFESIFNSIFLYIFLNRWLPNGVSVAKRKLRVAHWRHFVQT